MLKDELDERKVYIGRDKFFHFLRKNRLLVPKSRNFTITTMSLHRFFKYPNLIKDLPVTKPEQVWVADITYIKIRDKYLYLSLITDAFSKRIMGFNLADNLRVDATLKALQMATKNRIYPNRKLIHHSDRGFQYCNPDYTSFLEQNKISISMTTKYDPYENAIAERVNGIIKNELLIFERLPDEDTARKAVEQSITTYNFKRPHLTLHYRTPIEAHKKPCFKLKSWRKLSRIKANTRQ